MKMEEISQDYPQGATDSEATLVQPRFDESEAQTAQKVIPLTRNVSWQRRLPVALVLISALVGGLVSVVAYRVYQRTSPRQATHAAAPPETQAAELSASAPATENAAPAKTKDDASPHAPQQSDAANDEAATAPKETATAPKNESETKNESTSRNEPAPRVAAPEKHDDESAKGTAAAARVARRSDEESSSREDRRRADDDRAARESAPRSRRVDVIPSYPDDGVRVERDRRRDSDEATDYQLPPDRRDDRHGRHGRRRNIDRIRDIFGAPPPA